MTLQRRTALAALAATAALGRPALAQSWPGRLHQLQVPRQLLIFRGHPDLAAAYAERRMERVVGVMYVPADELANHYRHARLSGQFDAVIHLDLTHALPKELPTAPRPAR